MWQIERKSGGASGRTLLDALDAMERPPKLERYPLRIAVHSVYKLGGTSSVLIWYGTDYNRHLKLELTLCDL